MLRTAKNKGSSMELFTSDENGQLSGLYETQPTVCHELPLNKEAILSRVLLAKT